MEFEKLFNIINNYIMNDEDKGTSEIFCNEFMDTFYSVQDDLEKQVSQNIFEAFDDINLICDSYEVNEDIRKADKYCIDEIELKKKIIQYMEILKTNSKK